jgi:hypothetical protein
VQPGGDHLFARSIVAQLDRAAYRIIVQDDPRFSTQTKPTDS